MLIDVHAHLNTFADSLDSVLEEVNRRRIFTISNSLDPQSYERNKEIAARCPLVLPIFGVHPWNAPIHAKDVDSLRKPAEQSPILGEIGLDHHFVKDAALFPAQRKVFEFLLSAAREQDKIVILHTKGAEDEVVRLLDSYAIRRAIVHWYSGPQGAFKALVSRGAYFSIGVEVLYSDQMKAFAREVPTGQLLTETDCPGGMKWLSGTPGRPAQVRDVVDALAKLKGVAVESVVETVRENLLRLIADDARLEWVRALLAGTTANVAART